MYFKLELLQATGIRLSVTSIVYDFIVVALLFIILNYFYGLSTD